MIVLDLIAVTALCTMALGVYLVVQGRNLGNAHDRQSVDDGILLFVIGACIDAVVSGL